MLRLWLAAMFASAITLAATPDFGCSKPLTIGLADFGVFSYEDATHKQLGVEPEILDELARRSGCKLVLTRYSRPMLLTMVAAGKLPVAGTMADTPEREVDMDVVVYVHGHDEIVLQRRWSGLVKSPDELLAQRDINLAVITRSVYGEPYDALIAEMRKQGRVVDASDTAMQFRWLKLGRVQAAIGYPFQYRSEVTQLGIENEIVIRRWADKAPPLRGGLALSRKVFTPEQLRNWESLMGDLRHDGTIARILSHYLDADTVKSLTVPN